MIKGFHSEILLLIKASSGKPTRHTFSDAYLGNDHVRYPIAIPALRTIAKDWMREHRDLTTNEFAKLLTSLIEGKSSTEKTIAGLMLGYAAADQRKFDPSVFDKWLDHLVGWAEVDAVCTGDFTVSQFKSDWPAWKQIVTKLSRDRNINKRRAALVLFCSPLSRIKDERMADTALQVIERLKPEKEILITKAISWLLRSMTKHYRERIADYLRQNADTLPKIALRETQAKLMTGKKTKGRPDA